MLPDTTYPRHRGRGQETRSWCRAPVICGCPDVRRPAPCRSARKGPERMRKQFLAVLAVGVAGVLTLSACGDDDTGTTGTSTGGASASPGKVGVILPDTASSARWEA